MKRNCVVLLVLVFSLGLVAQASAEVIEIQITGLDLVYSNSNITDATDLLNDRTSDPADADRLTSMIFLQDGNIIGSYGVADEIFADVRLENINNIPALGGLVTSGGNGDDFGFDLLTPGGSGLALDVDVFQVFYSGQEIAIAAAGTASSVFAQDLPFGLELDPNQTISIVISSTNVRNFTYAGSGATRTVTGFTASSTGSVRGTLVPEPSSFVLAVLSVLGILGYGWFNTRRLQ